MFTIFLQRKDGICTCLELRLVFWLVLTNECGEIDVMKVLSQTHKALQLQFLLPLEHAMGPNLDGSNQLKDPRPWKRAEMLHLTASQTPETLSPPDWELTPRLMSELNLNNKKSC